LGLAASDRRKESCGRAVDAKAKMSSIFVDVSHSIEEGLITYKGLPAPIMADHLSREESRKHYAPGTEFHIGRIEMVANTGTYLDSPFHRYAHGKDLSQLPLSSLADLNGVVVQKNSRGRAIDKSAFDGVDVRSKAVLLNTGWDRHWKTDQYFQGHPFLTRDAAEHLAQAGAALVGIDSLNIDSTDDLTRPAHSILLAAGIPIVEHLCNLSALPESGFRFFAVPAMVKKFGSFPVRAFAIVE
jgi:kynurenine formamidase